jgi:diadenosine tetraphosphate (Ap4A) HIT family hydrolase
MSHCVFCLESQRPKHANAFLPKDWPYSGRVLFAEHEMFCVPGYSPQVYPYVLVIPRRHIRALSETTGDERKAMFSCLNFLLSLGPFGHESLSIFEHGACAGHRGTSCIEHFHLHVISGGFDLQSMLDEDYETDKVTIDEKTTFRGGRDYLLAGAFNGAPIIRASVARSPDSPPQYFRRMLAGIIRDPRWDWHQGINPYFMRSLMDKAQRRSGWLG